MLGECTSPELLLVPVCPESLVAEQILTKLLSSSPGVLGVDLEIPGT